MTDPDLIGLFIEPLELIEIRYMITGGVAAVIYGEPRFTRDIDIVLELRTADIERMANVFSAPAFYVPPIEALEREVARVEGGHFNLIHRDTALRADIYLFGNDPLHAWAFERRARVQLERTSIWVAPIEYVIIRKLQYFQLSSSDRHVRDVARILQISGDAVDRSELDHWVQTLGLAEPLAVVRAFRTE